jgi:hypothetical protein
MAQPIKRELTKERGAAVEQAEIAQFEKNKNRASCI